MTTIVLLTVLAIYGPQILHDARQAPSRWAQALHLKKAQRQLYLAPLEFDRERDREKGVKPDSMRSVVPDNLSPGGRAIYLLGQEEIERIRQQSWGVEVQP